MPKVVDHEARRFDIAAALWRLVADGGIQAATIRNVAAAGGWSRSSVQHYFASKQELLGYACRQLTEQALAQVRKRHETLVGREALCAVLSDCAAEQADRWFELIALASRDPAVAAEMVRLDEQISVLIAEIIEEMIMRGEAAESLDAVAEARAVFAFNVSLKIDCHMQPRAARQELVEARIDEFLERMRRVPATSGSGPPRRVEAAQATAHRTTGSRPDY